MKPKDNRGSKNKVIREKLASHATVTVNSKYNLGLSCKPKASH